MKTEAADKLRYGDLSVSVTDQYDREKRKAHYEIPDAGDSSHPGCRKFFNKRFHKQLTHNCSKPNSLMHNVLKTCFKNLLTNAARYSKFN